MEGAIRLIRAPRLDRAGVAKLWRAARMPVVYRSWRHALYNRLVRAVPRGEVLYELRSGARFIMAAGPSDVRILNEIWLDRIYEPARSFRVQNGWTVLDLGAHKGAFSVRAALSGAQTQVYAFEPAPANLESLRKNVELNRLKNVHVHGVAVGTARRHALLQFDAVQSGRGSLVVDRGYRSHVPVSVIGIDELVANIGRPIDLLKMDIEGAEYDVLGSASTETLSRIRRIVLEYHATATLTPQAVAEDLCSLLTSHGFRCGTVPTRCLLFGTMDEVKGLT